jgi:hypothetical protein
MQLELSRDFTERRLYMDLYNVEFYDRFLRVPMIPTTQ